LLRPETPEEGLKLPAQIIARMKDPSSPLKARAKALGLTMVEREVIPPTRRAHQCTEYARSKGKLNAFHAALIERYWSKGENLNDWASLEGAAAQVGLDGADMKAEVSAGKWLKAMQEGLDAAHELRVAAVPTFIIADKFVVQGAQEARVFKQAFERLGLKPKAR
jgi:predicted DsbA family dithiol-disulfide isomerase